jgi:hypothetical protein
MFIPDPDLDFLPNPGSRIQGSQKDTGSRIQIRNTSGAWEGYYLARWGLGHLGSVNFSRIQIRIKANI